MCRRRVASIRVVDNVGVGKLGLLTPACFQPHGVLSRVKLLYKGKLPRLSRCWPTLGIIPWGNWSRRWGQRASVFEEHWKCCSCRSLNSIISPSPAGEQSPLKD
jgi:hypothetical protein